MSEVDVTGQVLSTFTHVDWPEHLSTDSEDHVFVADCFNDRILLLNSKLQLERVLVDRNSQVKRPSRLHYNELTSQLHVVHFTTSFMWCSSDSSDDDDGVDVGVDSGGGGGDDDGSSGGGGGDDNDHVDDDDDDDDWRISVFSL